MLQDLDNLDPAADRPTHKAWDSAFFAALVMELKAIHDRLDSLEGISAGKARAQETLLETSWSNSASVDGGDDIPVGSVRDWSAEAVRVKVPRGWELVMKKNLDEYLATLKKEEHE